MTEIINSQSFVVKLFAKNDVEESKKVVLNSTRYTFYIVLIIVLPLLAMSNYILHIWLKEVPEYTEEFFESKVRH